jgi:hypothetical protein
MIAAVAFATQGAWGFGIRAERPRSGPFHPLDDQPVVSSPLTAAHPFLLTPSTTMFRDTTFIDYEKRQLTFSRCDSLGVAVWTHHYGELSDYLIARREVTVERTWYQNSLLTQARNAQETPKEFKLAWELPVQYPGWAQRVLGNEPPRLSINGNLKIKMSYEDIQHQTTALNYNLNQSPGFVFEEENQFTVTGSVGRLININISANSQGDVQANDPLKNFKIDYKESKPGELEDEVVQQVTAGYTNFDMPGTQLSGYSESHEGLFGIKIATKFGPLSLTTIASNEQGEAQKLSISNNGGATQGGSTIRKENEFLKYRYYFLDTQYIKPYCKKHGIGGNLNGDFVPKGDQIETLEIWKKIKDDEAAGLRKSDPSRVIKTLSSDSTMGDHAQYVLLLPDRHYHLEPTEGWFRFYDSLIVNDYDQIAIYMRTQSKSLVKGGFKDTSQYLWVLKADNPKERLADDPEHFSLMFRNVYEIPQGVDASDLTKFKLKIYHLNPDNNQPVDLIASGASAGKFISDEIGVTDKAIPLITLTDRLHFASRELILPPYDTTAKGIEIFNNPDLDVALRDSLIYRFGPTSKEITNNPITSFCLEMSGSSKKTEFDLGLGVMEASVRVTADGSELVKNQDYIVNIDMGKIELISPRAKAANKIDIEYQREALFTPDRKVFLGAHAEMALPFISDKSLVGLSVLWQGTSTNQLIPRIGQEPYSKLLLDLNAKLDFAPAWMTALINKLPLIKTDAASSISLEFETAHSSMNPNTTNQAYVDDFESSKQVYTLGEITRNWYMASPPVPKDSIVHFPPAFDICWFQPVMQDGENSVLRVNILKSDSLKDAQQRFNGGEQYASILRMDVTPAPPTRPELANRFRNAWAGMMTWIPPGMYDRKRDQYFEVLICAQPKNAVAPTGKVRFQFGRVSEDLVLNGAKPNGNLDKEDTSIVWRQYEDLALDKGIDTVKDQNEIYWLPDGDTLVPVKYGSDTLGPFKFDPSKDNYQDANGNGYDNSHSTNGRRACRLEGDRLSHGSEDINSDGVLATGTEQYHEFIVDLADTNSPYIDRTVSFVDFDKAKPPLPHWRRYRFPLHEQIPYGDSIRADRNVSFDDWSNIRNVRIIWNGFDTAAASLTDQNHAIDFSGMQFVGNQWEAIRDSSGKTSLEVSTTGTQDNAEYKTEVEGMQYSNPVVRLQKDETNHWQQESSLRLVFDSLAKGKVALAQKSYAYQPLNISSYDQLTLVVSGRPYVLGEPSVLQNNGNVRFVFRFGSDSSTYYEYSRQIYSGWNNLLNVDLKDFSKFKLDVQTAHANDTNAIDTTKEYASYTLRLRIPKGRQPNFANITWMAVGVYYDSTAATADPQSGELWIDELKVVGMKKFSGWSTRVDLRTQWADFLTLSSGIAYQGGDFRTMTDNSLAFGDSKLSGNLNVSLNLDKFLPKEWGVSIPVGGQVSTSLVRPQLKPNTDVYLSSNNSPDGFLELFTDAIDRVAGKTILGKDTTMSEHYETQSYSQSFFVNYSKASNSSNPAVNMLLERVSAQFNYSMSTNQTKRGEYADHTGDYVSYDSTHTYTGSIKYDLTPKDPPAWTKWKPFEKTKPSWVPSKMKDFEFSLLPSKLNFDLASANYSMAMQYRDDPGYDHTPKYTPTFTLNHGMQLDYSPIKPLLDISYSLVVNRDFANTISSGSGTSYVTDHFFSTDTGNWEKYYILDQEQSRTQHLRFSLNPQFFDWLTHTADYNGDYSGSLAQRGTAGSKDYMNAKVGSGFSFNSSLAIGSLLQRSSGDSTSRLAKIKAGIKKGCDFVGFQSVNFTYSANSDLQNNLLSSSFLGNRGMGVGQFTAYQFGLNRSVSEIIHGDMNDNTDFGGMRYREDNGDVYDLYKDDTRRVTQSVQVSTGLAITKPFDFSLSSISLRWSKQFTTWPDTAKFDTTVNDFKNSLLHPEFSVSAHTGALSKVKMITRYFDGMGVSSSFSYKQSQSHNNASTSIGTNSSYDFAPLVSLEGTLKKWPIKFNYQHTMGTKSDKSGTNVNTVDRDGDNLDMSYEIPPPTNGKSTVKILGWTIPIRGRTSMGMRITRDHSVTTTNGTTSNDVSNLSVAPNLSYIFTDNVTGRLEYTGSRNVQDGQTTTSNIVSLVAEIKF